MCLSWDWHGRVICIIRLWRGKEGCFVFVSAKNVFSAFHKTGK